MKDEKKKLRSERLVLILGTIGITFGVTIASCFGIVLVLGMLFPESKQEPRRTYSEEVTLEPTRTPIVTPLPTPTHTLVPTPVPTKVQPTPVPAASPSGLTFNEIERGYQDMTDLQWPDYAESLKGTRIHWVARVLEVHKDGTIVLDIGTNSSSSCYLDGLANDIAITLNKDQVIEFDATITNVSSSWFLFSYVVVWLNSPVLVQ